MWLRAYLSIITKIIQTSPKSRMEEMMSFHSVVIYHFFLWSPHSVVINIQIFLYLTRIVDKGITPHLKENAIIL